MGMLTIPDALKGERLVGPTRVLHAPITADVPAQLGDIIALVNASGVYAPVSPWTDFGLAADPPGYTRGLSTKAITYYNVAGDLDQIVDAVNRSAKVNIGSISAENAQIWEDAPSIDTIVAAAGVSEQQSVAFGSFTSLTERRIVMLAQRSENAALVTETDASTRGALVGLVLYRCQLAADDVQIDFGADDPISAEVGFTLFPELGQPSGEQDGKWLFEQAGTIT